MRKKGNFMKVKSSAKSKLRLSFVKLLINSEMQFVERVGDPVDN